MDTSTAQKMMDPLLEADPSVSDVLSQATQPVDAPDDGLLPPTKLQVYFWAQLCGAVHARGRDGMLDEAWPPDLAPEHRDLTLLVERGLLVRRHRAWKLRRRWYERLCALKARAVATPVLERLERPAPDGPTYAELEAYERICRWLDARPHARSRLPFAGLAALGAEDEEPITELRTMRRLRLVRHTSRCEWALSSKWREQLDQLHKGLRKALRQSAVPTAATATPSAPVSLCAGLDTWGLNWLVEAHALPARLRRELDDYQCVAHEAEREVETRWAYDGVPLRMYQAGVRAKGAKGGDGKKAKGVSWSYILVNPSLRLLIRRTPLGGIVANARLGSECLWRRTPLEGLSELDALVRRLWGREKGTWQVSYAHLAHDVANAPLDTEQLERYVSRSRRRATFDAAQAEVQRLARELQMHGDSGGRNGEDVDWDALPTYDWQAEYADDEELLMADPFAAEGYEWDVIPAAMREAKAALEEPVEQRSMTVHHWGKHLSGVAFSQGGPVSFVMYRKDWESRLKGKRHMEPLWKAAGWNGTDPVTRHEARLVREPIRELRLPSVERSVLDDPWGFLACEGDVWGSVVGRAEACPSAVDVAWIRRVVPREGESNRSRWDTDPTWRVVQRADFGPTPLAARRLIRAKQRIHDLQKIDQQLLGLLKTREALLHVDPTGRDLSLAVRDMLRALERELQRRGGDFGEAARVRRRDRELPVGPTGKVLPFRPRREDAEMEAERERLRTLEAAIESSPSWGEGRTTLTALGDMDADGGGGVGHDLTHAWLRWRCAETRMRSAYEALEAAELAGRSPRELERLAITFERASAACVEAQALLQNVDTGDGPVARGVVNNEE